MLTYTEAPMPAHIPLFLQAPHVFNEVALSSSLGSLFIFFVFLAWAYKRGLLVFA